MIFLTRTRLAAVAAASLCALAGAAPAAKSPAPKKKSPAAAKAAPATPSEPSLHAPHAIADGVWAETTKGGANAGWFTFGDSVVAVDAGRTDADAERLLADIAATAGKKRISYLILTNDFGPHAGGAAVFARRGASIICDENFAGAFQALLAKEGVPAGATVLGVTTRLVLARPDRHVIVRHLGPADSAGDIAVLLSEEKVLFSGDLAESILLPPLFSKTIDPEGWVAALTLLGNLNPKALVPGYGPPGPPEGILATRDYLEHAIDAAQKIVREKTTDEFLATRLAEPDVKVQKLPPELEKSHEANLRALVEHYRSRAASPAEPKKP
ncbi:MAG TPA: MBL fold metallo-hydrolase [Thermoanaerobaculia bacterium]|nr:MBL fold metallo-hydrolase [Thermoanaerobaculia bacterium]